MKLASKEKKISREIIGVCNVEIDLLMFVFK